MDLSGSRPRTTAEISAAVKAKQRPVHHLTDLDVYFKTAEFVGLEAAVYREEENWQELFRVLLAYTSLVVETIRKHKDWTTDATKDRRRAETCKAYEAEVVKCMEEMESLKPRINAEAKAFRQTAPPERPAVRPPPVQNDGQTATTPASAEPPLRGRAEAPHLRRDRAAVLVLPPPDALEELVAAELRPTRRALARERALDEELRRDARVVRAGHVERRVAAHAVPAREAVLDGRRQGVAQVERPRDVRRRDDDDELLRVGLLRGGRLFGGLRTEAPRSWPRSSLHDAPGRGVAECTTRRAHGLSSGLGGRLGLLRRSRLRSRLRRRRLCGNRPLRCARTKYSRAALRRPRRDRFGSCLDETNSLGPSSTRVEEASSKQHQFAPKRSGLETLISAQVVISFMPAGTDEQVSLSRDDRLGHIFCFQATFYLRPGVAPVWHWHVGESLSNNFRTGRARRLRGRRARKNLVAP